MTRQPDKTLEQIVQETGRYPVEAFIFIQECIGSASEMVHGAPPPEAESVLRWMSQHNLGHEDLHRLYEEGGLPAPIASNVEQLGGPERLNRHVTGQELCRAVRDVALNRWGLLARGVLARWNITRTEDIGAIVYALVNNGWLQKQPTDSIDDFNSVFSFKEAFESYRFENA